MHSSKSASNIVADREEAAYGEVVSLQEEVATLRGRCAAAESGLGQVGSQLAKKSAAVSQKDGQIKRLVTACSVLEQKVRTLGSGGSVDDAGCFLALDSGFGLVGTASARR